MQNGKRERERTGSFERSNYAVHSTLLQRIYPNSANSTTRKRLTLKRVQGAEVSNDFSLYTCRFKFELLLFSVLRGSLYIL